MGAQGARGASPCLFTSLELIDSLHVGELITKFGREQWKETLVCV